MLDQNSLLKMKFRRLYTQLLKLKPTEVLDYLYQQAVIRFEDYKALRRIDSDEEKWRELMVELNGSGNPRTFIELRQGIDNEPANSWFIEKLDNYLIRKYQDV